MGLINLYEGFIFDYGQVLVHPPTAQECGQMAGILGVSSDVFEELYWSDRLDYDKGLMSGAEYWQDIAKRTGKVLRLEQVEKLLQVDSAGWMHFDEPMWEFVEELRSSGKRVAMLSNMPMDLGEALKAQTQRLARFDHVTLSYEVKSVKPEAAIYEECLAGIGTAPNKTIFFDDKIANVKGAEMLGICGIEFLDRDAVLKRMRGE